MPHLNYPFIGCGTYKMLPLLSYHGQSNNEHGCTRVCGVCMMSSPFGHDKEADFLKSANITWKCSDSCKTRGTSFRKLSVETPSSHVGRDNQVQGKHILKNEKPYEGMT